MAETLSALTKTQAFKHSLRANFGTIRGKDALPHPSRKEPDLASNWYLD
ncbi:MAG: hypothetical protein QF595_08390 [Dehalococcoidia bacterium]|nr:hypothetical protein [Dehalococcoidia bacterium]